MSMTLRGNNFVADLRAISVIKATIEGLIGDDKYYFALVVNNRPVVLYVSVKEIGDKMEFALYKDNSTYVYQSGNQIIVDELLKVITNADQITTNPKLTRYDVDPAKGMSSYVEVYIDALQTM